MIVQPKIRGFICTTAHPVGCARYVQQQIEYVKQQGSIVNGAKKALIIGASTGYGLASRIVAAFGCGAATLGVFFEKPAEGKRTASAGWYNTVALEQEAQKEGLYAHSFNGDAFSDTIKGEVVETLKKSLGGIDLVIYSLASPRRQHPKTGEVARSVIKPIKAAYTNRSIDTMNLRLETVTLPAATQEEIDQTVSVMGGEDWELWIHALGKEGLLAPGIKTIAYSYIGPDITQPIYRQGTIGKAKDHLEETARRLDHFLKKFDGRALVSINKALVTQSSSAIPYIPLYFVLLKKVLIEKQLEEETTPQIYRLFSTKLYGGNIIVDKNGFIRMDDFEMRSDVQRQVNENWEKLTQENLPQLADLEGYQRDFLKLFGFGVDGVDYNADVEIDLKLPSLL